MWEAKLPWKSVAREQTSRVDLPDLSANMEPFSAQLGTKGQPPKAGAGSLQAGWLRMQLSPSVSVWGHFFLGFVMALCIWKFLQSLGIIYFEKHNLTPWCLLHINWERFFETKPQVFVFFFGATAGVRSSQFDFSVTSKLFPTWSDSSSAPTGQLSDGFESTKCQDLSQLI